MQCSLWCAALGLFFIGGLLTTVAPPLIDKSWNKPFENTDPAKGPTGKLVAYTDQEMRGYKIYIREGCKYCHTQQTRTLASDVKRSGWKGVTRPYPHPTSSSTTTARPSAPSAPDPIFRASAANTTSSGTRRTSTIRATWFPAPIMPPFPWIANNPQELDDLVAYLQTRGRAKDWRPDNDYEK